MKTSPRYVLGLDIGIQSVGWAVIRYDKPARIEDFGVRVFDTTENPHKKNNSNQDRRAFRSARRVLRRRSHRKAMIKLHLQRIGLLAHGEAEAFFEDGGHDLLSLRVKGLSEKLSPVELAACLLNITNHRGYQNFYSLDEEDLKQLSSEEKKEYKLEVSGLERVAQIMEQKKYRSVAEMLLQDDTFAAAENSKVRIYRSHPYNDVRYPISRDLLRKEASDILNRQSEFYPVLKAPSPAGWPHDPKTLTNSAFLLRLMFEQRDFEDGPGNKDDEYRKYTGFLMSLGYCQFYREEKRGPRMTVLGDLFAVVNALSQYTYIGPSSAAESIPPKMAQELIRQTVEQAQLPKKTIRSIAEKYSLSFDDSKLKAQDRVSNCIKFMRRVRPILEANQIDWSTAAGLDGDYLSENTMLNKIGRALSLYQTPRRRKAELLSIPGVTEKLASRLVMLKLSGTAKVSNLYMRDAIEAFCKEGTLYGKFQWNTREKLDAQESKQDSQNDKPNRKLNPFSSDAEFAKNSVVMRSLNETRKIINAIIGRYGPMWAINIEVASDLGRSWSERGEIQKQQRENEKKTCADKKAINELMGWDESENRVTGEILTRYRLGVQQKWECMYTGKPIEISAALNPGNPAYEVDHIVPFSFVLDNTLNNKVLVCADANQTKWQRTPLEYLANTPRRQDFIDKVNQMAKDHIISERKLRYLLFPDLSNRQLLDEWKSRNLNDTRYIAKYLRGYLERELAPAQNHRKPFIFPVKGGMTDRFRKIWLNQNTWGTGDKDALREITTLHHAVDAVIIAAISPATAQIAEDNMRLNRILKKSHNQETAEYRKMLERSIDTLEKYYHLHSDEARAYLTRKNRILAPIQDLNEEVDVRFGSPGEEINPNKYCQDVCRHYNNDPEFAAGLRPPLTSRKQERKSKGPLTAGNPLGSTLHNGILYEKKRVDVLSLTGKQLDRLCTNDSDLRDSLTALLAPASKDATVGEILAQQEKTEFRTARNRLIRKVTLLGDQLDTIKIKQIGDGNQSVLKTTNYYCIELYSTPDNTTRMRGISRADLVRRNKKLFLACPNPADYGKHIMYLFKNDYITVTTRNGLIFDGFYQSPSGIKQAKLSGIPKNCAKSKQFVISARAVVKKYDVSLLGKKGGEISCGEPLSLLPEKS